jgi:glutathione peroxidase-family protein
VKDKVKDPSSAPAKPGKEGPVSPLEFKLKSIDGKDMDLAQFKGKPVLLVNVASKCGLTKQYERLQASMRSTRTGLVVLGLPANNFNGQEPAPRRRSSSSARASTTSRSR